jgi:hypothetical protein
MEPTCDGSLDRGLPVLGPDAPGDDPEPDGSNADMTVCDRCGELFPDYEIAHLWFGTEDRFLCGLCQETSPDVDRQIDRMRGK